MIPLILLLTVQVGGYQFSESIDPITDKPRYLTGIMAGEDALLIGCDKQHGKDVFIAVSTKEYLGSYGLLTASNPITYRFDKSLPIDEEWFYSDNSVRQLYTKPISSFLTSMMRSQSLTVRIRDQKGAVLDKQFQLPPSREAISYIVKKCDDRKLMARLGIN